MRSVPIKESWIPQDLHDQQIASLSDRVVVAEESVKALLNLIDPELLARHLHDYVAAVKELVA